MIIDPKRCIQTTYKLTCMPDVRNDTFDVTVYPRSPAKIAQAFYRLDVLPEWVRHYIRVMDIAGCGYVVDSVGRKIGNTYWIEAQVDVPNDVS